jgi:hypothetical protein
MAGSTKKYPNCGRLFHISNGHSSRSTLPFSCPFDATKSGKRQQAAAQSEGQKSADSARDEAGSGNAQHAAAKGGYRFFFRLLTGGLLVRIQPEEPAPKCEIPGHR